jgi:hypothetical protein
MVMVEVLLVERSDDEVLAEVVEGESNGHLTHRF